MNWLVLRLDRTYNRCAMGNSGSSWHQRSRSREVLWAVVLATVVAFLAWIIFGDSLKSGLVAAMGVALIYALPMIALTALVTPLVEKRIDALPAPMDWVVFFLTLVFLSAISITVSSGLMVLARMAPAADPWPTLRLANRLAFSMFLLFAGGSRIIQKLTASLAERNRLLEEKIAVETQERTKQTQDMERAWEIQQGLLPKELPRLKGCEVAAGCTPARVVGGDYFDVIRLGDTRVAIAIADVVGKGMAAALLMSNLQAIVRSFVTSGISPAELCSKANEVIAGNIAPGKFITFFCAVIDTERLVIEYCNAGHNPPMVVKQSGEVEKLVQGGPLLGVFPEMKYDGGSAKLSPGDVLVLYTDGITEAERTESEEFGEARLLEAVARTQSDGAEAIKQNILDSVRQFAGESLQDDVTLVVLTTAARRKAVGA